MKKILYLVSTLRKTGPTNQLSYIIKYLDRDKFKPIILTLSPESQEFENSMMKYFQDELTVEINSLNLSRVEGVLFAKAKIEKFIQKNRIDLIHTQGLRADILSSKLNVNIPKIATIRNYPQLDFAIRYGKIRGYLIMKSQIKALEKLDICCGVSDAVTNNLKKTFNLKHLQTVRNGVDISKYFPLTKEQRKNLQNRLSLPTDKKIWISSIGKDIRKDSSLIAKAFKKLYQKDKNNFIIFVGDGLLKLECESILKGIDDVLFTGKIDDVKSYLQSSHYFISASKAEGLPNAVLEAMACGLPQLLSDIEPHKEIINLDNRLGILFETGCLGKLYNAMQEIDEIDYEERVRRVLNVINNHLTSSKMSKNYQTIYEKLKK